MLCYYKFPKGSVVINGRHVYGYLEAHGPVKVPWRIYRAYRNTLIQAPYNKSILEDLFPNRVFPDISFTYGEIRYLTWEQMCDLCKAFGLTTGRSNKSRRKKLKMFMREHC